MTKAKVWFLLGCSAVLVGFIFIAPSYGWRLRDLLGPRATGEAETPSLAAENEALLAEIATLQSVVSEIPKTSPDYIRAMVYSRYPLSFRSEVLVNAGSDQGVAIGKAVVFQGIFIGTVEKVFADSALIETVFDANFKMPVRLGSKSYDGLLTGGAYPRVVSIAKNAPLAVGDIAYTAAPGIPYGLPVGIVQATSTSADDLFIEAPLGFAYDMNAVDTVLIAK